VGTASPPPPHAVVRRRGVGPHAVSSNASMTLVSAAVTDADSSHTAPSIIPSGFSCRLQRRRSLPAMLRSMEAPPEGGALHASVTGVPGQRRLPLIQRHVRSYTCTIVHVYPLDFVPRVQMSSYLPAPSHHHTTSPAVVDAPFVFQHFLRSRPARL
jgi:hypothetical protein